LEGKKGGGLLVGKTASDGNEHLRGQLLLLLGDDKGWKQWTEAVEKAELAAEDDGGKGLFEASVGNPLVRFLIQQLCNGVRLFFNKRNKSP
jgi:hypothetical protein